MEPSGDSAWLAQMSQTGCVSAGQGLRNGARTSEFHVTCHCQPKSLLSEVAQSLVEDSEPAFAAGKGVASGVHSPKSSSSSESVDSVEGRPILVAQIGECRYQVTGVSASIQLTSGRLLLPGETVLVSRGVPHYSENSQLAPAATDPVPPAFSGPPERDLLACVGEDLDGACLFYKDSTLQLGGRQPLMRQPLLLMSGRQHRLEALTRAPPSTMTPPSEDDLQTSEFKAAVAAWMKPQPFSTTNDDLEPKSPPLRTLLLLGGRCLIRGSSIVVLSGLLHFAGAWHRVGNDNGSGSMRLLPRISGEPVLPRRGSHQQRSPYNSTGTDNDEDEFSSSVSSSAVFGQGGSSTVVHTEADVKPLPAPAATEAASTGESGRPLLLSNARLYAQGGTVFSCGVPLLTSAVIAMSPDSTPISLERQESLIRQLSPPACWNVARLFLRAGRFRVGPGLLIATEGVAWLRAKKVLVGPGPMEQLTVSGALVFPQPVKRHDCVWYVGRDLLYKDGLLYLDDLTPVLKGGRVCVGQQEVPLEWLSGIEDGSKTDRQQRQSVSSITSAPDEDLTKASPSEEDVTPPSLFLGAEQLTIEETDLLTEGVCLMEPNGCVHILRGRFQLGADTILIDQGVAHFAPVSGLPKFDSACFPPPRIVGRPLTRPSEARRWATLVDQKLDTATFVDARLSVRRGSVWLNGQVPLLKGCKLLLNGRPLDSQQLLAASNPQLLQTPGFTGSYSVFANCKSEVTVFSLRARFADGLHFLFGGQ